MKVTKFFVQTLLILLTATSIKSQELIRCGTQQLYKNIILKDPSKRVLMDESNKKLVLSSKLKANRTFSSNDTIFIPVVFHLLLTNQTNVTDQQVHEQLIRLNEDFAGKNADSIKIPNYFKALQGKSIIQFKLAQRTPDLEETTGIIRYSNALTSYNANQTRIHYTSMGGADAWDAKQYVNIWVGKLQNSILGQASYPLLSPPEEDGIILDYGTLPNGYFSPFNKGRTLTHEMGHFFHLYHIWGDDDGACNGTDEIDDTPNQEDATSGCHSGRKFDSCTSTGDGIMYQNFMDYSTDDCMVMFTNLQIVRMITALEESRPTLLNSLGHEPVLAGQNNVTVMKIVSNGDRVCDPNNIYDITFKNIGAQKITQLVCSLAVNNNVELITLNVDLDSYETYIHRLNVNNLQPGTNKIAVQVLKVNNLNDDDPTNNLKLINTIYATTRSLPFKEDFTTAGFPPVGWYIQNPDEDYTWTASGLMSAYIPNFYYSSVGQTDRLVLPPINLPSADSIFLKFDVAAATYSDLNEDLTIWDTLKVEISDGCSTAYQTIYKKTKGELMTIGEPITSNFVPQNQSQWRNDSIDISNFKNSTITISFTNINGYENNIYLDNISFRSVELPAVLREKGYLIAPNPINDIVNIRFLQNPNILKRIAIYDINGRRVAVENVNKGTFYQLNVSFLPKGVYFISIETDEIKHTEKVIKL